MITHSYNNRMGWYRVTLRDDRTGNTVIKDVEDFNDHSAWMQFACVPNHTVLSADPIDKPNPKFMI